jgi:hypothetical protein
VKYEKGFYIPEDGILHSYRRENLKSYIALTGWTLYWRCSVSPVKYEMGFYIPEDAILHSHRREETLNLTSIAVFVMYIDGSPTETVGYSECGLMGAAKFCISTFNNTISFSITFQITTKSNNRTVYDLLGMYRVAAQLVASRMVLSSTELVS